MERRKRAGFGNEAEWSEYTRVEFARHTRKFFAVCERAGQNNMTPDERWLAEHLLEVRETSGRSSARRYARDIGHYFRRNGAPALTDGLLVRAVLHAPDDIDPLAIDLEADELPFSLGRAQYFADGAFRASTYEHYTNYAKQWVRRCKNLGIDPTRPPLEALEQYFEDLGQVKAVSTIKHCRSALSYYFCKNKTPDLTRAPEIERILDGLKRQKPPQRVFATTAAVRHAMVASFEEVGAGVRDRVIVLLTAFARLGCDRISLIEAEQVHFVADGVEIRSQGNGPSTFVGAHDDRDLNIVYWMGRLLEMVPSGPLFRKVVAREMRFGDVRLSPVGVSTIVAGAARRAGDRGADMPARLRLLFEAETQGRVSSIIIAHQNNLKTMPMDQSESRRRHKLKARGIDRSASRTGTLMSEESKRKGVDDALAAAAVNGLTIRSAAAYLAEYFSARDIAAQDSDDSMKGSSAVDSATAPLHRKQRQRSL